MENSLQRFGLRDLAAVLILAVLLILMGIPTLAHSRRLTKREACAANLRTIGIGAKIYANGGKGDILLFLLQSRASFPANRQQK